MAYNRLEILRGQEEALVAALEKIRKQIKAEEEKAAKRAEQAL